MSASSATPGTMKKKKCYMLHRFSRLLSGLRIKKKQAQSKIRSSYKVISRNSFGTFNPGYGGEEGESVHAAPERMRAIYRVHFFMRRSRDVLHVPHFIASTITYNES
jgi:hypothetical protein